MFSLESLNLELTTKCPLRCPQCYCTLEGGKNIPLDIAAKAIQEAAELGAKHIELSGGETLCYPFLTDVIKLSHDHGLIPNIAISGWHFDRSKLEELIDAGIGGIFVSINAPTAELNSITRDGFNLAINALKILADYHFEEYYINWVMHRMTADTLPEMIQLVKPYHPRGIVIMTPKPDSSHALNSMPTMEQMEKAAQLIKNNQSKISLGVESCFSPLLAILGRNALWGNRNRGISKGCTAGLTSMSVSVDGLYSPCRHLEYFESFDSLTDYWHQSQTLKILRELADADTAPCSECEFCHYCRHCLAISSKLYGKIQLGYKDCPVMIK